MEVPHVYTAITEIISALAATGISKDRKNAQQGYAFRGIDDVYASLSRLLATHKLCILPRVTSREVTERATKSGGTLFYTVLMVEYDLVSAKDGSKHTICTVGEAMDSADKSSNKSMSAAYKYACIQAFCIPTEGDNDADGQTHELRPKAQMLADRFIDALESEIDGRIMDVHVEANKDQELYGEAWKLLSAKARTAIKAAIERSKVVNTNRPEKAA